MSNDSVRRSTLSTLTEIGAAEAALKAQGLDVRNDDDWMQLRDIVARIERRLLSRQPPGRADDEHISETVD